MSSTFPYPEVYPTVTGSEVGPYPGSFPPWQATSYYAPNQYVSYGGYSYESLATSHNVVPGTNSAIWSPIASSGTSPAVISVPAPTGVPATDMANIKAAITSLPSGGVVQLQLGTYAVTSASRAISVTNSAPGTTWTVTTGTVSIADVGSYVIGAGIDGRSPKILTTPTSTSFTTDIAPGSGITASQVTIVSPGIYLPDGVTLAGMGGSFGANLTGGTVVYDNGTGVSVFLRGGNNLGYYSSRSKIRDLSIWGSATGGTVGSTYAGVWINNNSSFVVLDQCDISGHLYAGLAMDYNQNNIECRDTVFRNCGSTSGSPWVSGQGGGVIFDPFNGYASAAVNFYNCAFEACVGFGLCGVNNDPVTMIGCQWNGTVTSTSYQSGTSVFVEGGSAILVNCWSESAANYEIFLSYGTLTIVGGNYNSTTSSGYGILVGTGAYLNITGASFENHTTATINYNSGSIVTWSGVYPTIPAFIDGAFITGAVSSLAAAGAGSYGGGNLYGASVGLGASAPTVTGTRSTVPPTNATIQTALGNLVLGTAYQNTLSYDVKMTVYLSISVNTSGVVKLGVGTTNTPTQATIITGVTTVGFVPVTFTIPAGDYALLSISGTVTDSIAGQYLEAA